LKVDRHIAERLAASVRDGESVCVGLSGGLDSVTLLHAVARVAAARGVRVSAVHVHHGLSPNADAWADFCRAFCAARGIALDVERVRVDRASPLGLEAAARNARYAVYASRAEDFLALAHHRDDQAETLLVQLVRGTGLKGASAMPEVRALADSRVRLWRPLLDVPRAVLAAFARENALEWIEDESNASPRHDRNYVRREIAPRLDARFPRWRDAAVRFTRHAASADALLVELARLDGLPERAGDDLPGAAPASEARRVNLLRAYLQLNGVAMPSEARAAEMARQLFAARADARVRIDHAGVSLVRFRDRIRLERLDDAQPPWRQPWNGDAHVELAGVGAVRFARVTGEGISAARVSEPGWHFAGRSGGERIRVHPRRPTRTLKNLLQECALPPWQRSRMPLLFHGERLVWAPGVGIEVAYACLREAPGLRPEWVPEAPKPGAGSPDVLK
jgi:tRNA(Ile)-lysidine synthase